MPDVVIQGPYEAALVAALRVVEKIIDGQPPEVKAELWRMFVEDWKAWREFWKASR